MDPSVIKSFLVGLGFGVDDDSLKKFNSAIKDATLRVTGLYAAIQVAAAGIFKAISSISESFEQMGYEYRIIAPAINKALVLRNELLKAYRAAGINIQQVIVQSVKFNMSLAKTKFALDAIYKSVGAKFLPLLTKQMDIFRGKIYQNMPKIQAALEKFVNFIFKAFEATSILGVRLWSILTRVYDFFAKLHEATNGWSTAILGVLAAWKFLNLSFLATPLGMILAGLASLLALYDDFKTYQEGGESFFNWDPVLPVIESVTDTVKALWEVLKSVIGTIGELGSALMSLFKGDLSGLADHLANVFSGLWDSINKVIDVVKGASGILGSLFGLGQNLSNGTINLLNNPKADTRPLGANSIANSSQTNQNVNQQTQINVSGAADAQATGAAVANQQSRVNYDMVRNLTGATR